LTVRTPVNDIGSSPVEISGPRVRATQPDAGSQAISDLRGAARLSVDAVIGVTSIVEDMHRNIAGLSPVVGAAPPGGARGISGLVYRSVRGITGLVGFGIDTALAGINRLPVSGGRWPGREAVVSALNGLVGDHLVVSGNPLAIAMRLRQNGEPLGLDRQSLRAKFGRSGSKLLVLVHGLCMNDLQWTREGHDHGAAAARDFGYTPIYLHYNSGQHISTNGREFSDLMERLVQCWPATIDEIVIVGHSMGGLIARSACHYASLQGRTWLRRLEKVVFLGTPHAGAPLERAGGVLDFLVGFSPYTAPFSRLGGARSDGIKDLRHGYVLDEEWQCRDAGGHRKPRKPAQFPARVDCFAIAASREKSGVDMGLLGDGLVPVASALALHGRSDAELPIREGHRAVFYELNHFDLLSNLEVYKQIGCWLTP